jgi:acyl-CoA thioesterase
VIFGGQLLGQSIVAAAWSGAPGKDVKTVHTVFARGGDPASPVEIDVDVMHRGRTFASSTVTIHQGDRLLTRSIVLSSADEDDLIRHGDDMPKVDPPDLLSPVAHGEPAWELRIVDDVDVSDPDEVGPAELEVWSRWPGAPDDVTTSQALLAYASDGFAIGTAMRPHAGVGQAQAHVTISTGVVSHTLTFHERFSAADWLLLSHRVPYAGHGRTYGRADVFTEDGALVASFVQDAMVRNQPQGGNPKL